MVDSAEDREFGTGFGNTELLESLLKHSQGQGSKALFVYVRQSGGEGKLDGD